MIFLLDWKGFNVIFWRALFNWLIPGCWVIRFSLKHEAMYIWTHFMLSFQFISPMNIYFVLIEQLLHRKSHICIDITSSCSSQIHCQFRFSSIGQNPNMDKTNQTTKLTLFANKANFHLNIKSRIKATCLGWWDGVFFPPGYIWQQCDSLFRF